MDVRHRLERGLGLVVVMLRIVTLRQNAHQIRALLDDLFADDGVMHSLRDWLDKRRTLFQYLALRQEVSRAQMGAQG